ncbi:helix-turn-helix domain-containing protein [Streptosporangium sp. KLBMP 9127]|nr:transcriptional regulator [Streptosporangium sp. KLBMP 9127]
MGNRRLPPKDERRRLRKWHEAAMAGERPPETQRRLISASWRRSLRAGVDPETPSAPAVYNQTDIRDVRQAHPLNPLLPVLADTVLPATDETGALMVVTDADGLVLWRDGDRQAMRHGDRIGLADGFDWNEESVGTNGIGTSLVAGRPVHVYAAEHLMKVLHTWSCSAAPITDPDSGLVLGCVDISGVVNDLHPSTVALVGAAAKLAESRLALRMRELDDQLRARYEARPRSSDPGVLLAPSGRVIAGDPYGKWGARIPVPDAGPGDVVLPGGVLGTLEPIGDGYLLRPGSRLVLSVLRLSCLGTDHPTARLDGTTVQLSQRHAEILTLLALNPHGMTAEQLTCRLYGDFGNPVTIRAEIHRLRALLGTAIAAKPYRLTCQIEADFLDLKRLLTVQDPTAVAHAYPGPLLPRSEAPAIRSERDELEGQVRARILLNGSPSDLWIYAQTDSGRDDPQILQRLSTLLPATDHRAMIARLRLSTDP